jgi:hypothetical protein
MKAKLLILFIFLASFTGQAQNSPIDKLFDKYSGKDGFTTVFISQYMFDMFKDVETSDKEFDSLVKGLKSIRILTIDKSSPSAPKNMNFFAEIGKNVPLKDYKELMVIKQKDQDVKFLVKEENGKIAELLLISGGKENVFICIQGLIDMKSIAKLSKSMNIEGMKPLENVGKEKDKPAK